MGCELEAWRHQWCLRQALQHHLARSCRHQRTPSGGERRMVLAAFINSSSASMSSQSSRSRGRKSCWIRRARAPSQRNRTGVSSWRTDQEDLCLSRENRSLYESHEMLSPTKPTWAPYRHTLLFPVPSLRGLDVGVGVEAQHYWMWWRKPESRPARSKELLLVRQKITLESYTK